jgi:DNA-binding HxlR family transcriptional regulator
MQASSPESPVPCPIGYASAVLGDRWTLLILRNATLGTTRFEAFRAELGIADNVLSARLAKLVDAGVLVRVPYRDARRTRHEYRLTAAGADLVPVLHALAGWGEKHTPADPMGVVHRGCGGDVGPGSRCERCGVRVERDDIAWIRPWRSPEPVALAQPV